MMQIDMHNYTAGREYMTSTAENVTVDVLGIVITNLQSDFLEMQSF
jgi:hypothetical protein